VVGVGGNEETKWRHKEVVVKFPAKHHGHRGDRHDDRSGRTRMASSNAETACMVAVNRNYGGNVDDVRVVRSEFSEANSEVILDADGERWRCLASDDGVVDDLSVMP
jgi:hypothetical protein